MQNREEIEKLRAAIDEMKDTLLSAWEAYTPSRRAHPRPYEAGVEAGKAAASVFRTALLSGSEA